VDGRGSGGEDGRGTPVLVGVDVGTSALKVAAVGVDGLLLAEATEPYPTQPFDGVTEQDAEGWWVAATRALPRVVADRPVRAVAVTGQAPTLVAVDRGYRPRGPALTWADRRAEREAHEIADWSGGPGGAASGRSGAEPAVKRPRLAAGNDEVADPFFGTAKLLWWLRHRADLDGAHAVLAANGFLTARLTGVATLDESTAGLFQGWRDGFAPAIAARLPLDLLPPAVACARTIGAVTPAAAAATGLPAETPVVAGAIDAVAAAFETGTLRPGDDTTVMTGTSTVTATAVPAGQRHHRLIHTRHAVDGVDLVITATVTSGAAIDWVRRLTGRATLPDDLAELPTERPGRLLFSPALGGERTPSWNPHARGVLAGLDLAAGPDDLLLAAYEGTAFALADNLEALALPAGARLRACGGGARSRAWLQITADVTGRPVSRPALGRGAAAGAALIAGCGLGYLDLDRVALLAGPVAAAADPDPVLAAAYARRLPAWRAVRDAAAAWSGAR
jgi:xylulokinase